MNDVAMMFKEGGWTMYPVLLLGAAALPLSLLAAILKRALVTVIAASVLAFCVGVAAFGTLAGRRITDEAAATVLEADAEIIRAVGYAESMRPLQLAGILAVLALPFLLISVVRACEGQRCLSRKLL